LRWLKMSSRQFQNFCEYKFKGNYNRCCNFPNCYATSLNPNICQNFPTASSVGKPQTFNAQTKFNPSSAKFKQRTISD